MSLLFNTSSSKVQPDMSDGLDADEAAQIAKLGAIIAPVLNNKPTFKSQHSKKGRMDSAKSQSSKNMSSFLSTNSEMEEDDGVPLEIVINFLTNNIENILKDRLYIKEFEEMCLEMMKSSRDPELHRIVKSHGWTGTRFKESSVSPLDLNSLLQDLSNLYLRYKVSVYTTHITSLYEAGNAKATDQIFSFVPDTLLSYLCEHQDSSATPRIGQRSSKSPTAAAVAAAAAAAAGVPLNASHDSTATTNSALSPSPRNNVTLSETAAAAAVANAEVRSITFTGACMLADISGFSKFSGNMCSKGVSGLDELREATNGFLGHIVKTVYEFNGDVVAFAGDALICVFLDPEDEPPTAATAPRLAMGMPMSSKEKKSPNNYCYRALQCASVLKDHKTKDLSAHIGVTCGEMKMALLGGLNEQWVYLMNGECVCELAACIESAGSQEIAATRDCYNMAMEFVPPEEPADEDSLNTPAYKSLTAGMKKNMHNKKIDLSSVDGDDDGDKPLIRMHPATDPNIVLIDFIDPRIFHKEPSKQFRRTDSTLNTKTKSSRQIEFKSEDRDQQKVIESAALFVPRPILSAIYSEALDHIGELRHVTTAFVSLDSYDPKLNSDPCTLQPFFLMAQKILQEAGGFLRQFLVDDKGCVFIAMWGMPSFTYSNNASRALYCGVAISMGVKALGHRCSIGISTGNVFCGTVGAPERRDYAGIGTDVNMAARLMGKAHGRVLLDVKTYHNLNEKTRKLLTAAEEMKLKGNDVPVTPYQYSADHVPTMEGAEDHHDHAILRRPVKTLLGIQIDKISNSSVATTNDVSRKRHAYFTLVIGPPGTGKSTAVEYFRHSARKRNIPCFFIKARPEHEGVPYGLMRELFLELVGEHNFIGEEQQKAVLSGLIEQAYLNKPLEEKKKAMFSLEIVMGVEWGKSNRKVGSFTTVVQDVMHSSKKMKEIASRQGGQGAKAEFATLADIHEDVPSAGEDLVAPLPRDRHAHLTESPYENMLFDSSMTHLRLPGDMSFYNVLCVLLKNRRVAIILEDAHFCDELSWTELSLILNGRELEISVLMTMRSNTIKAAQASSNGGLSTHSFAATNYGGSFSQHSSEGVGHSISNPALSNQARNGAEMSVRANGHRNSVLVNAISTSVSRSISIDSAQMANQKGGAAMPSPVAGTMRSASGDFVEPNGASRFGLKAQCSPALLAILGHERATVIEMTGLAEAEVREVLLHTLKVVHVSSNLVKLVFDVSSGNAYWCKAIANFIKERGVKELEDAIQKGDSPHQALKVLILMRMEKLDVDHQVVLKNAAIIGDEFSVSMLQHVLPARIQGALPQSLDLLAEHGFIFCMEESPEIIFAFQNELIRETLYELMPPRDSANIHLMIAQFIEKEYAGNLRPFYPMLSQHYRKSIGYRGLVFKYELKAADQAISRGAFNDGLIFLEAAAKMAVTKPELNVVSDVIARALRDIAPISNAKIAASVRKVTHKSFGGTTDAANSKIAAYLDVQAKVQIALDKFAKNSNNNVLGGKAPNDARLTWQPSYVASKMSENDSDDESNSVKKLGTKTPSSSFCVIS